MSARVRRRSGLTRYRRLPGGRIALEIGDIAEDPAEGPRSVDVALEYDAADLATLARTVLGLSAPEEPAAEAPAVERDLGEGWRVALVKCAWRLAQSDRTGLRVSHGAETRLLLPVTRRARDAINAGELREPLLFRMPRPPAATRYDPSENCGPLSGRAASVKTGLRPERTQMQSWRVR